MAKGNLRVGLVLSATDRMSRIVDQATRNSMRSIKGLDRMFGRFSLSGAAALAGLSLGTTELLDNAVKVEKAQSNLVTLMGGNRDAAMGMYQDLLQYAYKSPYNIEDINKAGNFMLATGTKAEKLMSSIKAIGDAAQGNSEKFEMIYQAYGKAAARGYILRRELNSMMSAGFNPLIEISEQTGLSMEQLFKSVSRGEVDIDTLTAVMKIATSEGGRFYGAIDRYYQSNAGKYEALQEELWSISAAIGQQLLPIANSFLSVLTEVARWVGANAQLLLQLTGVVLGAYAAYRAINFILIAYNAIMTVVKIAQVAMTLAQLTGTGATAGLTTAQLLLNAAMTANPVGAIIVGITVLIGVVMLLWNKFAGFRAFIKTMWDTLKAFGNIIKDYIVDRITGLLRGISGLGEAIALLFRGEFSQAWEKGKQAADDIVGFSATKKAAANYMATQKGIADRWAYHSAREESIQQQKEAEDNRLLNPKSASDIMKENSAAMKAETVPASAVTNNNAPNISYNPQITIQGNASKEDIKKTLKENKDEFENFINDYFEKKRRTGFNPAY